MLHLFLLKVTKPRGQCLCSLQVCREHDVADAIPGSRTPARSHWSAVQCSENSEIYYQYEHVLIDQVTCFCSLCAPNCTGIRTHTHINIHTHAQIQAHTHGLGGCVYDKGLPFFFFSFTKMHTNKKNGPSPWNVSTETLTSGQELLNN